MEPSKSVLLLSRMADSLISRRKMDQAIRLLQRNGFSHIGTGAARTVYGNGEHVLKLEKHGGFHNASDNAAEHEFYMSLDPHTQDYFAATHYVSRGEYVLVMSQVGDTVAKRIREYGLANDHETANDIESDCNEFLRDVRSMGIPTVDLHNSNIAFRDDDSLCIIDYGAQASGEHDDCCHECGEPHSYCECCHDCGNHMDFCECHD